MNSFSAPNQPSHSDKRIALSIAGYEIHPLPTGIFGLDGGAMFGTVPKVLWEKAIPSDEKNRIPMEARALLLKSPKRNIIIDAGNGSDFTAKYGEKIGPKFAEMYNVDESGPTLMKSLAKHGLTANDITDVIFTHLHFDHCGGGVKANESGELIPAFPKAQYYLQEANLETAKKPNIREKSSYFSANYAPLIEAKVLTLLKGEIKNFIPGLSALVSNGHTVGHQMIQIKDEQNTLLYCGDLIPTSAHVRLAWIMGYDLDPLKLIEEKTKILKQAANENWFLFFEHDPVTPLAQITAHGTDFAVKERFIFA